MAKLPVRCSGWFHRRNHWNWPMRSYAPQIGVPELEFRMASRRLHAKLHQILDDGLSRTIVCQGMEKVVAIRIYYLMSTSALCLGIYALTYKTK